MLSIFHSHPASSLIPSKKDMALAFYPECVYIIISLAGGISAPKLRGVTETAAGGQKEIKGFKINKGEVKEVKKILFVCTENSCRSQMAEGWAKKLSEDAECPLSVKAFSCGSQPRGSVDENAIKVMKEAGVDISKQFSKGHEEAECLLPVGEKKFDIIISMGCKDKCPSFSTKSFLEWDIPDPRNGDIKFMRKIRDVIKQKVEKL